MFRTNLNISYNVHCFPYQTFVQKRCIKHISTDNLKINISSQDVSTYTDGPYTGEVSAFQLKKLNIDS